jgi:hypothetical protein
VQISKAQFSGNIEVARQEMIELKAIEHKKTTK